LIPAANIAAWRRRAPWPEDNQVEQDLILSRLMIEIANDELLGSELAFRGGTCLHKLHLPRPLRYSEDLDYVRRTKSGVKGHLQALRDIAERLGLGEIQTKQRGDMVHARFDADPTTGVGRIRIKVEINIAETESFLPRIAIPYEIASRWWSGRGEIDTFQLEELLGTKLLALYQRSKGRDLFDLWLALSSRRLDAAKVVAAFRHYSGEEAFTYPELRRNLATKLDDRSFREDLSVLVMDAPIAYEPVEAASLVMERLGSGLRNAPSLSEIRAGTWRH
jgi:predicted nucleotidyltransferase component of viral defense system